MREQKNLAHENPHQEKTYTALVISSPLLDQSWLVCTIILCPSVPVQHIQYIHTYPSPSHKRTNQTNKQTYIQEINLPSASLA